MRERMALGLPGQARSPTARRGIGLPRLRRPPTLRRTSTWQFWATTASPWTWTPRVFESIEDLVMISDQRAAPGGRPVLLITPNLVKLGRAADAVLALPLADWLQKNSPAFHQAFETVRHRRGKTILHENLSVARVGDLALKVALEKALGDRIVSLGEDSIAFPQEAVAEVKRIVTKLGHVVKEVPHRGN